MNREYIVTFHIKGFGVPTVIKAENSEIALDQAQGMAMREWICLVDVNGITVRLKASDVSMITCELKEIPK